jgi:hypothetical protein
MDQKIPKSSYIEFETHKLAHARVLWVNFDLLREMGVDIPAEGLTPEFEQQILDAFAWAVPNERDKPGSFLDNVKKFFADRYGGSGLGVNWGSGRAGSAGQVQIKGIGITPLVGEGQTFDHAHGGASLEESIREAVWGEVNNQELPWGANRVMAIIDSGTDTKWADGSGEARAEIVRVDPVRPAWFARAFGSGKLVNDDQARTTSAIRYIEKALPVDPSATTLADRVKSGFNNYVDRMADQYAAAYARGLYHGATSISNFQIDGAYIDYGTQTAQAGFAPIKILNHVGAFGDMNDITSTLIGEFRNSVASDAPDDIKLVLPSLSDLEDRFTDHYSHSLRKEMLILTGAPPETIEKTTGLDSATKLSDQLQHLATFGLTESVNVDKSDPNIIGKYDIREILSRAASVEPTEAALTTALKDLMPAEPALADAPAKEVLPDFVHNYIAFRTDIEKAAASDGVGKPALATYFKQASKIRNRKQVELYRNQMQNRDRALIDAYRSNGDRSPIWNEINNNVAAGNRTYRGAEPYQLVIKENPDLVQGTSAQIIFDAKTGKRVLNYRIEVRNNYGYFFGNKIGVGDLRAASLRTTQNAWSTTSEIPAKETDGAVEFKIPLQDSGSLPTVEFTLHSADNSQWWKNHGQNAHISLAAAGPANGSTCVVDLSRSWGE